MTKEVNMKRRKVNDRAVQCSERDCKRWIPIGQGFYLGKRGKNRVDFYLCIECDARRQRIQKAKTEHKKSVKAKEIEKMEKEANKPLVLFETVKVNSKFVMHCGCTGVLPE
jgi:hypothetical protein